MIPTPNLFIIGAMKAGTTSFHEMLNQHSQINMSSVKEPVYFAEKIHSQKSFDWYLNLFDANQPFKYYGESSVSYSKYHHKAFKGIPNRILKNLGQDIKFIYILRDPIERSISHFIDSNNFGHIHPKTEVNDFLDKAPDLNKINQIMTSCYHYQIQEYLTFFPKENILLLEYEDIFKNTEKLKTQLSNFLDLEFDEIKFPELNVTSEKKYYSGLGYKLLVKRTLISKIKPLIPQNIYNNIRDSKLMNKILYQKSRNNTNKLSKENTKRLIEFFKPEVEKLKAELGFKPLHWRDYYN